MTPRSLDAAKRNPGQNLNGYSGGNAAPDFHPGC
jgi:hypothetical protein